MDERGLARMRAGDVGVVLQGAMRNLLPYATPIDNVRFAQRGARKLVRGSDDEMDAGLLPEPDEVLELVGLGDHAHTSLTALSPGQRQRLAVGVGLAARPGSAAARRADQPARPRGSRRGARRRQRHQPRPRHHGGRGDARPRRRRAAAADRHDPGRPGGRRGSPRRGLRGGRPGRLADAAAGRAGARATRLAAAGDDRRRGRGPAGPHRRRPTGTGRHEHPTESRCARDVGGDPA